MHQLTTDGQAETGAAEDAGIGLVGLGEGLEDMPQAIGGYPDARVADHEAKEPSPLFVVALGDDPNHHHSPLGELHGVPREVDQDLPDASLIPPHEAVYRLLHGHFDDDALLLAARLEDPPDTVQHGVEIERLICQRESSGLDAGEVEDLVDDLQELFRGVLNRLAVFELLPRQLAVEQQGGHADDAVHRSPDLVAHVGQEPALRLAGRIGPQLGLDQLHLALLDGVEHLVEGARELARLVEGLVVDPLVVVPLAGHLVGHRREVRDGRADESLHPLTEDDREDERGQGDESEEQDQLAAALVEFMDAVGDLQPAEELLLPAHRLQELNDLVLETEVGRIAAHSPHENE